MNYNLPVIIRCSEDGEYIARCEEVRATATGDSPDEAVNNLQEAIKEMIEKFGESAVFQDIAPELKLRLFRLPYDKISGIATFGIRTVFGVFFYERFGILQNGLKVVYTFIGRKNGR